VGRVEAGQRGVGKAAAKQGRARGLVQSGDGVAGALHMAGRAAAACGQRNREGRAGGGRQGPVCDSPKILELK
jgi:hypothetical protein